MKIVSLVGRSLVALWLVGALGCSQSTNEPGGTGGAGTGGSAPGTGGTSAGTGGSTPGTGGTSAGTGGTSAGTGGVTTGTGGNATGSGGAAGAGGLPATGTGGAGGTHPPQGGASGASGGRGGGGGAAGASAGGAAGTGAGGAAGSGSTGPSAGCGKSTARPDRKTQQTITIDGTTRYYLLNVPSGADASTPLPLVFALHGYDMNNVALVDLYDFTSQSGNKAITVLPQGEGPAPGNTSHWGDSVLKSTWSANTANYDFMQALKADIESKYCVDTSRVYITGFSMGGMFTNSLACDHNDWFRGFAPVEGGGPGSCAHADAKPSIIIHQGTADTIATPQAGEGTRDFWLMQNGCNTTTTSVYTGCQSYGACDEPVVYCTGNWTHTVSSTARANVWKFFDSLK